MECRVSIPPDLGVSGQVWSLVWCTSLTQHSRGHFHTDRHSNQGAVFRNDGFEMVFLRPV